MVTRYILAKSRYGERDDNNDSLNDCSGFSTRSDFLLVYCTTAHMQRSRFHLRFFIKATVPCCKQASRVTTKATEIT